MQKWYWIGGVAVLAIFAAFFVRPYTSSPGYTTEAYALEFYATHPSCSGWSILLNREATYADAPGQSLCIGWLH